MEALLITSVVWAGIQFVLSGVGMIITAADFGMHDYDRQTRAKDAKRFKIFATTLALSPFGILTLPALILYAVFKVLTHMCKTTIHILNWEA